MQCWPILGHIKNIPCSNPFVIGIYTACVIKPKDVNIFLEYFINEMLVIENNGVVIDKNVLQIRLCAVICDMPAKPFITFIKAHTHCIVVLCVSKVASL